MVWWLLAMVLMTAVLASFYPVIRDSPGIQEFIDRLPAEILAVFGISPATFLTGAGYLQAQLYSFVAPIIVIAFSVTTAGAATAREEKESTMDMLLSLPVGRARVILEKAASLVLLSFVIVSSVALTLMALNTPLRLELSVEGIVAVSLGLWLLGVVFAGVTMITAAFTGSPAVATGAGTAAALIAWIATAFSSLFSWLEWPSRLSPFSWYLDDIPLISGLNSGLIWLLVSALGLIAGATLLFTRRDIATEQPVIPDSASRRRVRKALMPRTTRLLRSVLGKTVWDRRRSVWVWALGLASLTLLTFAAWPALASDPAALAALLDAIPKELLAMFGLTDPSALATPEGFVSSRTYGSVGPIVMIVFSIGAMTSFVAKEESSGLLDQVVSNPVSRRSVMTQKAAGVALLVGLIAAVLLVVALVGNVIWETEMSPLHVVAANIGLGLLGLCFFGMAMAIWALLGGSGPAVGITAALAVITYFLNGLGAALDLLEPFRVLSPFYWYLGDIVPLAKGLTVGYLALAVVGTAGVAVGVLRFRWRDLAV